MATDLGLRFIGAFTALWALGMENNVYAQIGLVILIGMAVKNAILIVEFAKLARERGTPLLEAALEGACLRLRPITIAAILLSVNNDAFCKLIGAFC